MSNYTKNTNFTAKDNLTSGDPAKVIKGAEFDTEFNAIQTAVNSKADSNNSQLTGSTDAQAITTTGNVTVGGNLDVTGNATISGNLTFGNADTDTVSFSADIDSNIIPDDDNTYDLGSATKEWRNLYVDGTANIDSLVADTADINGGAIDGVSITGTTASFSGEISANGGIALGDNDRAKFGAGDDLQIYHDGANSYIGEFGTGDLKIRSNKIRMEAPDSQNMIIVTEDEGVQAFYNGAERFSVTSTGVDVTGTVTADGLTVGDGHLIGDDDFDNLVVSSSDSESIVLSANNSTFIKRGGTSLLDTGVFALSVDGVTGDVSFYEDTGTTAKFHWDASAERLGIGTSSPDGQLDIRGGAVTDVIVRSTSANSQSRVLFQNDARAYSTKINTDDTFQIKDETADSTRLTINSSGNVGINTSNPVGMLTLDKDVATLYDATDDDAQRSGTTTLAITNENGTQNTFAQIAFDLAGSGQSIARIVGLNDGTATSALAFVAEGSNVKREVMRLDGSGNVGIGTSSPTSYSDRTLHVTGGATSSTLKLTSTASGNTSADGFDVAHSGVNAYLINRENGPMMFSTNDTERARIDSSGNLLVGTTDSVPGVGDTNTGVSIRGTNGSFFSRSGTPVHFNRSGSDGNVSEFYKDGLAVGSIGVDNSDNLYITGNSSHAGLMCGSTEILPYKGTTLNDGVNDIGSSIFRWKDLYLSGGVYLGGTGSANKLDDYETGTFTPVAQDWTTDPTNLAGEYIKIGNLVQFKITFTGGSKSSATAAYLDGLPFTNSGGEGTGSVSNSGVSDYGNCLIANSDRVWLTHNSFSGTIYLSGVYQTT